MMELVGTFATGIVLLALLVGVVCVFCKVFDYFGDLAGNVKMLQYQGDRIEKMLLDERRERDSAKQAKKE